jgi:Mg2+/citrate symporter
MTAIGRTKAASSITRDFKLGSALTSGLTGIDLADHQKFAFPFLLGASVVMTIACVLFGVFPL